MSAASFGYCLRVAVMATTRRPAQRVVVGWAVANLARFAIAWLVLGAVFAAAVMITEGDGFSVPTSPSEILAVPLVVLVFGVLSLSSALVGLFLLGPGVVPGLAVYLVALWFVCRALPPGWQRAAAVALSPVIVALFILGADEIWALHFALLAGAVVYGRLVKLTPSHGSRSSLNEQQANG